MRKNKFIGYCIVCGSIFYRSSKYSKKQLEKAKYCSKKCANHKEHCPSWNGGKYQMKQGYIKIKSYGHPYADVEEYVMEHRLKMEEYLGRYLLPEEVVHHIDGNKINNFIGNLILMTKSKHISLHKKGKHTGIIPRSAFKIGHIPWNKYI